MGRGITIIQPININININRFVYRSATRARLLLPYLGPCASSSVLRQGCVVAVFNVNVNDMSYNPADHAPPSLVGSVASG